MDRGLCVGERAASVQLHHFSPASLGVSDTEQSNLMEISFQSGIGLWLCRLRGAGARTAGVSALPIAVCEEAAVLDGLGCVLSAGTV